MVYSNVKNSLDYMSQKQPGGGSPGASLPRIAPRVPIAPFALAAGYVPRFERFFPF
jgi:hypothetical protein